MGNHQASIVTPTVTQTPTQTETITITQTTTTPFVRELTKRRKVKIGVMCFGFVPCKHFVHIEGFPGWAVYDARQIAQRFVQNPEAFELDSKFMPELDMQRPDANHFEPYIHDNMQSIDPEVVLEIHSKKKIYEGEMD